MANKQSVIGAGIVVRRRDYRVGVARRRSSIEGTIHGKINLLPGSSVDLGFGGQGVNADVAARHVVVNGQIRGNVRASERVEIRAAGSLIGDASAPRILIEDGAFVQGAIQVSEIPSFPDTCFPDTCFQERGIGCSHDRGKAC